MSDPIDDDTVDNSPRMWLRSRSRGVKTDAKNVTHGFQKNNSGNSSESSEKNCAKLLRSSISEAGCSKRSDRSRSKSTQNEVKHNNKVERVKRSQSKNGVEGMPSVKRARQLSNMSDSIDDNTVDNSPRINLRSRSRGVKTDTKNTMQDSQKNNRSSSRNYGGKNCAEQLRSSNSEAGCSKHSDRSRTKSTQNEVKSNKKVQRVERSQSKNGAKGEQLVRREQNVSTSRSPGHDQPTQRFLMCLSDQPPNGLCDSDALYYKKNFKKKKESLGRKLFQVYNEKVFDNKLPHDIHLKWSTRLKKTAGYCHSRRTWTANGKNDRTSRIVLSNEVVTSPERLRDILLHEVCHAASWIMDLKKDGHGPCWRAWAKKAMKIFPGLPPITRCHDYDIPTKFTYRCVGCGYSIRRDSKPMDLTGKRCGYCYGDFDFFVRNKSKAGVVTELVHAGCSPRGFTLFVKDNLNDLKKEEPGINLDVAMKLLRKRFDMTNQDFFF